MGVMAASAAGRTEFFLAVWLEPQRLSQKFKEPDSPWFGSQRFSEETGRGQHKLLSVTPLPRALASLAPSDPQICPVSPNRGNFTSSCNFTPRKLAFLKRSKAFYSWWKGRYIIPCKKKLYLQGQQNVAIILGRISSSSVTWGPLGSVILSEIFGFCLWNPLENDMPRVILILMPSFFLYLSILQSDLNEVPWSKGPLQCSRPQVWTRCQSR